MATYDFATITPIQALNLQETDIVTFHGGGAREAGIAPGCDGGRGSAKTPG